MIMETSIVELLSRAIPLRQSFTAAATVTVSVKPSELVAARPVNLRGRMTNDAQENNESDRAEDDPIIALAHLDPIAYDQQRVVAAKAMGVRVSTLDVQVAQCHASLAKRRARSEKKPDVDQLAASAKSIIECDDVLGLFAEELSRGVAGETKNAKTLYLVGTSRLFAKTMHAAIKGPSS